MPELEGVEGGYGVLKCGEGQNTARTAFGQWRHDFEPWATDSATANVRSAKRIVAYLLHVVARLEDDRREENEEEKLLVELYQLSELFEASNVLDEDTDDETEDDGTCCFREELAVDLSDGVAENEGNDEYRNQEEESPREYARLSLALRLLYSERERQGLMRWGRGSSD